MITDRASTMIVWDFDGTIANTYEAIVAAAEAALAAHDAGPCDRQVVRSAIGLSLSTMFERLTGGTASSSDQCTMS